MYAEDKSVNKPDLVNITRVSLPLYASMIWMYNIEFFSNEEGLEFREEVVFPDGTVYKGQLKDG